MATQSTGSQFLNSANCRATGGGSAARASSASRIGLPVSGDHTEAQKLAVALLDEMGFDAGPNRPLRSGRNTRLDR
jgi:hypothetical protein